MNPVPDVLVMGVSGCGKSTVGKALADSIGSIFLDADDFHPPENVARMAAGIPLTDEDRAPWLAAIATRIGELRASSRPFVLACSALRRRYRDKLILAAPGMRTVLLEGPPELIRQRLLTRKDHFMPPALLDSQFAALEPPSGAIRLDISQPLDNLVTNLRNTLNLHV